MYLPDSTPPGGQEGPVGSEVFVDHDRLEQQADRLVALGEELRNGAGSDGAAPPRLGTAPPAIWLAARLAELTAGSAGVPGTLRTWGDGLAGAGRSAAATARAYRNTDDANSVTFRTTGVEPGPADGDPPGAARHGMGRS